MAIIAYHNALRVEGWIGNLALLVEADCFMDDGPDAKLRERWGRDASANGQFQTGIDLPAEGSFKRMCEELLPLLERTNKLFVANLDAISRLRWGLALSVSIGAASQVNVRGDVRH